MLNAVRHSSMFDLELARAIEHLAGMRDRPVPAEVMHPISEEGPPTLTIGLATYDDFDGAYFTVSSLLTHHPEAMRRCEIVILDNHPEGNEAEVLREFAFGQASPPVRYVPYSDVRSTAVRDVLFAHARSPWLLVVDSHVLLAPGALDALLAYIDANFDSADLIQGPIVHANGEIAATHMKPEFGGAMYGTWDLDPRIYDTDTEPFEIPLHGLALFAMRVDRWPGINRRFSGFGGEEGYVHERVRQAGGVTLCLPALRWHHRFARPRGVPYPMNYEDRVRNYLVGWREIGWDTTPIHRAFSSLLGDREYARIREEVERRIDHPGDCTAVCIASDDDRVGPWRSTLAEADAQGLSLHRIPLSRRECGEDWWELAVERAIEMGVRRRWNAVTVLDERVGASVTLLTLMRALDATVPGRLLRGTLGGETVLVSIPESLGASPQQLREVVRGSQPMLDLPLDDWWPFQNQVSKDMIEAAWTINDVDDFEEWESLYRWWTKAGMGQTMHRLPALAEAEPELQHAFGLAEALRSAQEIRTPIIVARSGIRLSEDLGPLLVAILRELESLHGDSPIVSLSTLERGVDFLEGDPGREASYRDPSGFRFLRSFSGLDSGVLLIPTQMIEVLAARLPEPNPHELEAWYEWLGRWGTVERWLHELLVEGVAAGMASVPALAVTRERRIQTPPACLGRMRR